MSDFQGDERRQAKRDDHDVLTRIDANLSNFMSRFEMHVEEDKNLFDKIDARTARLEKFFWGLIGAFFLFEIIMKINGK